MTISNVGPDDLIKWLLDAPLHLVLDLHGSQHDGSSHGVLEVDDVLVQVVDVEDRSGFAALLRRAEALCAGGPAEGVRIKEPAIKLAEISQRVAHFREFVGDRKDV